MPINLKKSLNRYGVKEIIIISIEQASFINIENKKCKDGKNIINAYKAPNEDDKINFIRLVGYLANLLVRDSMI